MAESIVNKLPPSAMSFANKTNNPTVKFQKKQAKIFSEIETNQLNLLLIGPWGSGKTHFLVGLLEHGLKVFCLSTDFGGSGLVTVRNELKRISKSNLESNLVELVLENYQEVTEFLENPVAFFPQFYTFGFDLLFWDGFDNFQQSHIGDFVADMVPERKNGVSEAREAGLQFEVQDWGQIRQATSRALNRFFKMHNKVDGTVWHKVICCKTKTKQKKVGDTQQYVEEFQPNVQGAAQVLMGAAFSLILLCSSKADSKGNKVYKYNTFIAGTEASCKNRGFDLPNELEANPYLVWETITNQLNIKKGNKDSNLVEN